MKAGLFISFEGIEGSGKSTQATLLAETLRDEGIDVILVRDPGTSVIAEKIRELLKSAVWAALREEKTELFLYLAARAHLWETIIYPSLAKGHTVVTDRFTDSTLVYQGLNSSWSLGFLQRLNMMVSAPPNLTFLLDIDPAMAIKRITDRTDKDHWDNASDKMEQLRELYLELAKRYPERIKVLDGSESIVKLQARILSIVHSAKNGYLPLPEGEEATSPLRQVWGRWPGDETIELILDTLKNSSRGES